MKRLKGKEKYKRDVEISKKRMQIFKGRRQRKEEKERDNKRGGGQEKCSKI